MQNNPGSPPDPISIPLPVPVRGPAALAAAVPYLLPRPAAGTLVLAAVDEGNRLGTAMFRPLPDRPAAAAGPVGQQWAADIGRLAADGAAALGPQPQERFAVVVYLPSDCGQPPDWFGPALVGQGLAGAQGLLDVIAVFHGRWRSLICTDISCCPPQGRDIEQDSDALLAAAELVVAGLAATVAPVIRTGEPLSEAGRLLESMPYPASATARRRLLRQAWPTVRRPPRELDPIATAALGMAADRPGVRDALLLRMVRAADRDAGFWERQCGLWRTVGSRLPLAWTPGPACLVAVAAWGTGQWEQALLAVQDALEAEPRHRMAHLLRDLLLSDHRADTWFDRMRRISEADCLRFDRPPPASRGFGASGTRAAG